MSDQVSVRGDAFLSGAANGSTHRGQTGAIQAPPVVRAAADDPLENFKIRRDMVVHEDQQINHRVTVTITTQSLLFTATVLALISARRGTNGPEVAHLIVCLSVVGICFGLLMTRAIHAARDEQDNVKCPRKGL